MFLWWADKNCYSLAEQFLLIHCIHSRFRYILKIYTQNIKIQSWNTTQKKMCAVYGVGNMDNWKD